jgi:hypothetical protein
VVPVSGPLPQGGGHFHFEKKYADRRRSYEYGELNRLRRHGGRDNITAIVMQAEDSENADKMVLNPALWREFTSSA